MRLVKYLNENISQEDIDTMMSECNVFLNDLKKQSSRTPELLYSGRKGKMNDLFKGKIRKNRKPLDTPVEIHNMIDDEFKKQVGIKPRSNSLFCFRDEDRTSSYGTPYVIFPVGKYKLIWSYEVHDLYDYLRKTSTYFVYVIRNEDLKSTWIKLPPSLKSKFDDENHLKRYIESGEGKQDLEEKIKELVSTYEVIDASQLTKTTFAEEIMVMSDEYWALKSSLLIDNELFDKLFEV